MSWSMMAAAVVVGFNQQQVAMCSHQCHGLHLQLLLRQNSQSASLHPGTMSTLKSGSTLRSLLLTPERIPTFFIPSRSPLLTLSPRHSSPDRVRLLSDPDDDDDDGPVTSPVPAASPRFLLRLPPRIRTPRHCSRAADTDVTTRAAMSLPHVEKVTTPYGFRAVLAASPCTRRRESLFHRNTRVKVMVTEAEEQQEQQEQQEPSSPSPPSPPASGTDPVAGTGSSRSKIRSLGLHMMKELKKPAAALKALSPAPRRTEGRRHK
ncbi:uncharacterized protein LOC103393807 isoform X4 [Cynoglossus semilaevis]|uniref:uncharacterized protein LOC103393807 isoform X4 n=1 Tax=Cynoglossus semilaevis TaxID=244447 RepID=UPI0007DCA330|nr:uncharacterized protein LOC103393807 isoform X4 [Cynoglossus semilaevis]